MYQDLEARDSKKKGMALNRLILRLKSGEGQADRLLTRFFSTTIVDRLVAPTAMNFVKDKAHGLLLEYPIKDERVTIHRHALRQLATTAGLPIIYLNRLTANPIEDEDVLNWRWDLLCHNFNELFHRTEFFDRKGRPSLFLHRRIGDELRGFMSRNYNRKLSTANLVRPFVETCKEYGASAVEAGGSDVKESLKYVLPSIFEPVDGEFIAFGTTFSNSDFGAGRSRISGTCMRISSGTTSVLEDAFSRIHLGSVIQESDLELSEETMDKELDTYQSAVRDTVRALLQPSYIERTLKAIQVAHEKEMPWYQVKNLLSKMLNKDEINNLHDVLTNNGSDIIDLPPPITKTDGDKAASAWWVSSALGWLASKESDEDKRLDLQVMAGDIVSKEQ